MDSEAKELVKLAENMIGAAQVFAGGEEESDLGYVLRRLLEVVTAQDEVIQECKASGAYDARQHARDIQHLQNARLENVVLRNAVAVYEQAMKRLGYELPSD